MIRFIHVGKCAGTSIGLFLRSQGVEHQEYHCSDANSHVRELLEKNDEDDFFLVAVRDPIKRFVSAFYYDLYAKRILKDSHGPHNFWSCIYNTFRTPNALAEALTSEDIELKDIASIAFNQSKLHMEFSLSWYISPSMANRLHKNNAFVIRTEMADLDMTAYMQTHHGFTMPVVLPREKSDYRKYIEGYDDFLSEKAIYNLKDVYFDDYQVLNFLKESDLIPKDYLVD